MVETISIKTSSGEEFRDITSLVADKVGHTGIIGSSRQIIVEGGKLKLGTWQGIYFCEFDGPRRREVWIKVISSTVLF